MRLPTWAQSATFAAQGCGVYNGLRDQSKGSWLPQLCLDTLKDPSISKGTSSFTPLLPPAIPLAVRSPYLSAWLPTGSEGGNGGYLAGEWAKFWPIQYPQTDFKYQLGWAGLIRVDNKTYEFLGNPNQDDLGNQGLRADQRGFAYTSTQSIFQMTAGAVEFSVTFLSPISPGDLLRQSLPFSYMTVQLTGTSDGLDHTVEVYSDITAEWASGNHNVKANWTAGESKGMTWYEVGRSVQRKLTEENQYAEWGAAIYASKNTSVSSTASGPAASIRSQFVSQGFLDGKQDTDFRLISNHTPVFAHSTPLRHGDAPVVFVIGHIRDPYVSYITTSGAEERSAYWRATFPDGIDALHFFLADYDRAVEAAHSYDTQVQEDALRVANQDHASLVTLSARQAMGTFEITIGKDKKGRYDENDVMAFLKEISSNGDMSTVDVIFPAFPIFIYSDPVLLKHLLEPLFVYSESGMYPNKWTVHDLGTYPVARGYNNGDDEPMPVEEAGNMLIMVLSYYQVTKDAEWLSKHYSIMEQWASFLITDGLIPAEQLSTDDFAGTLANQTDLAIKAIVGIGAMGEIAGVTGHSKNATYYSTVAKVYAHKWIEYAVSEDGGHTKLAYQDDDSWGTLYNLYGDRILNLNLVPHYIYDMQSAFYFTVANEYGVPLDSRHTWAKTDWEIFAAATTTSVSARNLFTGSLVRYLRANVVNAAFPDLYETITANFPGRDPNSGWRIEFIARPVSGGHFALLALDAANKANRVSQDPYTSTSPAGFSGFTFRFISFSAQVWQRLSSFIQRMFLPA